MTLSLPATRTTPASELKDAYDAFLVAPTNGALGLLVHQSLQYKDWFGDKQAEEATEDMSIVPWMPVNEQIKTWGEFSEIRVEVTGHMLQPQIESVTDALAYALAALRGDALEQPSVSMIKVAETSAPLMVLEFNWSSNSSSRTAPDFGEAFAKAVTYIREGSPVRKTDREGTNTAGTRLVAGVGTYRNVSIYVR